MGPPHRRAGQRRSRPTRGVERFEPLPGSAGQNAAEWLKTSALGQSGHIATYGLIDGDRMLAFYSLGMGEVELRTQHRKALASPHPRLGAVLVLWLARAVDVRSTRRPSASGGSGSGSEPP